MKIIYFWFYFLPLVLFSQNKIVDSLVVDEKFIPNKFYVDEINSICFCDENQNALIKIDGLTKSKKYSKYYPSISDLNVHNSLFVSFFDEEFNQIHFLDDQLFETQDPINLTGKFYSFSPSAIFTKNNLDLYLFESENKIINYINFRENRMKIVRKESINDVFNPMDKYYLNDFVLVRQSGKDFIFNFLKGSNSSYKYTFSSGDINQVVLYKEKLFFSSLNNIYYLDLTDKSLEKLIYSDSNFKSFSVNSQYLVVNKGKVFYFYTYKK